MHVQVRKEDEQRRHYGKSCKLGHIYLYRQCVVYVGESMAVNGTRRARKEPLVGSYVLSGSSISAPGRPVSNLHAYELVGKMRPYVCVMRND